MLPKRPLGRIRKLSLALIEASGTGPKTRESVEPPQLSPITKKLPAGIVCHCFCVLLVSVLLQQFDRKEPIRLGHAGLSTRYVTVSPAGRSSTTGFAPPWMAIRSPGRPMTRLTIAAPPPVEP